MSNKLFNYVIGNPPYQDMTESDSTRMPPVYDKFMDAVDEVADKVELIHPARFLFNAGFTSKSWNEKMLNDNHFKILKYEPDCTKVFPNTDIKGGLAVSYHDDNSYFGAIGIFTKYEQLNSVLKRVTAKSSRFLDEVIASPLSYKVSDKMKEDYPNLVPRLRSSAFSNLADIFYDTEPNDGNEYIKMIGLERGKRVSKYVRRDYIVDSGDTLDVYTLLEAKANGAGAFGETLSSGIIAEPGTGYLQTFIGIGKYSNIEEAENTEKYVKTKFARAMLDVLKITQDCPGPKWKYVPLQDFTSSSDIDWSQPISKIDKQLYKKYDLSDEEINFIETHVKAMD